MTADGGFSCLEEAFESIRAGQATTALQQLAAGSARITNTYRSEWWRLIGLAHAHLGHIAEAENAYQTAAELAPPASVQRGGVALSHGALLGTLNRRRDALRAYLTARDAFRAARYDEGVVLAAFNLGWSLLQLERVDEAAEVFEDAVLASERRTGTIHRPSLHIGRSLVASLRGDQDLAVQLAEWGTTVSTQLPRIKCLYRLAEALDLAGKESEARQVFHGMLADPVCAGHAHQRSRVQLALAILNRDRETVRSMASDLAGAERVRALLALAGWALEASEDTNALELLGKACTLQQPHTLALLESKLTDLYFWGRQAGLPLPAAGLPSPGSRSVAVQIRGVLEIHVNGRPVAVRVTPQAAALAAFLIEAGDASSNHLLQEALGSHTTQDLQRAAQRLCLVIGDPEAVATPLKTEDRWRLSERWSWSILDRGTGRVLGGLDSPFTRVLQRN